MQFLRNLSDWFMRKRLNVVDVILLIALIAGALYSYKNMYRHDLSLSTSLTLSDPWLVETDQNGNSYVVDSERSRIVILDQEQQVSRIINGYAPSGDTFYYIEDIFVDDDGGIYIHDVWWNLTGFSLDGECIMYYTQDGKFDRYVYEADYSEVYCDKHRVFGMTEYNDNIYFITADDNGFQLNSVSPYGGDVSVLTSYSLDDAITLIQDFAVDPASETIYAVDKRGALLKTEDGGVIQIQDVYQEEGAADTALYHMALDSSGNIYVTDIDSDRLLCFYKAENYAYETVSSGTSIWNVSVNGEDQISFVKDQMICILDSSGQSVLEGDTFQKGSGPLAEEALFDLALLVAVISAVYVFLRVFLLVISLRYSQNQRIAGLVAITVLIVTVIIVSQLFSQFKAVYRNEILNNLEMAAQIVSSSVDTKAVEQIESPHDYMNDDYKKLMDSLDSVFNKGYDYCQDIYCNILKYDGEKAYAMAYLDNSIGAYYPLYNAEADEVRQIYDTGESLQSNTVSETGSYIYVKVPMFDSNGEVAAVVEVGTLSDVVTNSVNQMLMEILIPLLMILLIILFSFSEIFSFIDLRSKYKAEILERKKAVPLHVVRVLVLLTFIAFNMATSFLPIYILKFVSDHIGISRDIAGSLPMSVNIACIGLTSLVCTRLQNRYGFRKVAVTSTCIALVGDLTLAVAKNYGMIVAGLVLNGIGVGIITNSLSIYIATLKLGEAKDNSYGFSIYNAASLSGISCGMIFGAALAETLGEHNVFFVTTAAWLAVMIIFLLLGKSISVPTNQNSDRKQDALSLRSFLAKENVMSYLILIQCPYIILNTFIYYYVPIFAESKGLGENESCMLIMICTLTSVYLSVTMTKYVSGKLKHKGIYLSAFITYGALLLFAFIMSVPIMIVALILIGIANSFGIPSRAERFTDSKASVSFGKNKALGIYNFVDNLGESAGDVIMATIASTGFLGGMVKLLALFTCMNGIFALKNRKKKTEEPALTK